VRFALEPSHEDLARGAWCGVVANELDRRGTDEESVLGQPDLAHAA
jgi:hypothetical protein